MPLSNEQIAQLLALPKRRGGGRRGKTGPDTTVRDYQTWFKLAQKMIDEDTNELIHCENENCIDPRAKAGQGGIVCAQVEGKFMCRHCFLDGWLLPVEGQTSL